MLKKQLEMLKVVFRDCLKHALGIEEF